jgi:hypothetical protein
MERGVQGRVHEEKYIKGTVEKRELCEYQYIKTTYKGVY